MGTKAVTVNSSVEGVIPTAPMRPCGVVVVHGTGGHGKVVVEAIRARDTARGIPTRFRCTDDAEGTAPRSGEMFIVAIGDNRVRQRLQGQMTVIHPTAIVSRTARIGNGTFIAAGATIGPCVTIGEGAVINTCALLDHDVVIGDYAHIAPGAVLLGEVTVAEGALIGANAVVRQGLTIGPWATVGCGAVVLKDVTMGVTVVGNPARLLQGA